MAAHWNGAPFDIDVRRVVRLCLLSLTVKLLAMLAVAILGVQRFVYSNIVLNTTAMTRSCVYRTKILGLMISLRWF